jgi:hypothetical protein
LVIGFPWLSHWYMDAHPACVEILTFPGHAQLGLQQSSIVVVVKELQLDASEAVCTVGSGFGLLPAVGLHPVTSVRAVGHSTC